VLGREGSMDGCGCGHGLRSGVRFAPLICVCGSQGGDAVWEGLRVYGGRVFHLDKHLRRLRDSARAMDFKGTMVFRFCLDSMIWCERMEGCRDLVQTREPLSIMRVVV
jgi:hypothetical protein